MSYCEELYKGYKISIQFDEFPHNPRDWENLGIMVCFHKRYNLGDKNHNLKSSDFNSWDELHRYLTEECDAAEILPLYLYDHSGITISTSPFSCPWDSGQVGFIYATNKQISNLLVSNCSKILEQEVKTYNDYLTGNVFYYAITKENDDTILDVCGSFYGCDEIKYMIQEAKNIIDTTY